jgi:hypothetical protein
MKPVASGLLSKEEFRGCNKGPLALGLSQALHKELSLRCTWFSLRLCTQVLPVVPHLLALLASLQDLQDSQDRQESQLSQVLSLRLSSLQSSPPTFSLLLAEGRLLEEVRLMTMMKTRRKRRRRRRRKLLPNAAPRLQQPLLSSSPGSKRVTASS